VRGRRYLGGGYVFVTQDLRGRFKSEGEYAMYRVPRGAFNRTATDESTDAWDSIDWLVKNVTPNNGRVGVWGTSYPGWLTLAALREPHPALAAAVPFNPVVDVWKADDWFHWGAFRAGYAFDFIYSMQTRKGASVSYPYEARDGYAWLLAQGSAASLGSRLDQRHEMWKRLVDNPAYGPYWKDCAADLWFAAPKRLVPTLHVHGFWDQEDIYGAPAAYAALETHDRANDTNYFAAGPWYHGQHFADGSRLGPLVFDEDTAKRFREDVLDPFLRRFLNGSGAGTPPGGGAPPPPPRRCSRPGRTAGAASSDGHPWSKRGGSTCSRADGSGSRRLRPVKPRPSTSRTRRSRCLMRRGRTGATTTTTRWRSQRGGAGWSRTSASSTGGPTSPRG
jgi:putative CocE/NonD family hydrolase